MATYERLVDDDGTKHGVGEGLIVSVFPDAPDAEVFQRHAVRMGIDGEARERVTWLVARLAGVKLYVMGDGRLVLTKQEMNP